VTIGSNDWEGVTLANGRYLITAKLGEGGMGFVYRAQDRNIDSDVVIKIPRQAMMDDPEFAGRFTREIRSLVKLSHPHIVEVTDVGEWEGIPFAVMQYLPGGSLEDQRTTGADERVLTSDPTKVSRWLIAVAEALDYIHVQGYVHRDVKPGNILFDAVGHSFLSDFGVAKVLASSDSTPAASRTAATGAGMVLGTPEYMAPELIMGEPFDGRADQYALAVTVYEMLCGRRPFEDATKTKVLVLHTSKAPPRLTE
jgi:serine/threonine protein kinase